MNDCANGDARKIVESRSDAVNQTRCRRRGNEDDAAGDAADRAVPDGLLLRLVPRSRQPGVRGASDGQGPSSVADRVRLGRRHLLPVVFPVRGPEQPAPGEVRRPPLDCPDHDHLGRAGGVHGPGGGSAFAVRVAAAVGRGRSGILSRRDSVSHLLVSGRVPRPDHRVVHGRHSGVELHRFAALGGAARDRRVARTSRMAMDVHPGSRPGDLAGDGVPGRAERSAGGREVAGRRGSPLAARETSDRGRRTKAGGAVDPEPGAV